MRIIDELFELTDRVALVTGASSGIGRAIASALASAGAAVVHAALKQEEDALQEAVTHVERAGGKATYVTCDVSRFDKLPGVVENVSSVFGSPDILVNAAGVNLREPWDKVSEETWNKTIAINLTAPFF
ncbi:MAG: SDR family NAD(P)-dependent oxidoreductase, partial [Deltaproteobacteria bacterium]|nr:SDR family NAD(P)-dependent oxidoreductase [Deltaproteobacteria bacterium]